MSTGSNRAVQAELIAAAWLIEHDYEVFLGFGLTSCDMIALKDGSAIRVEVKSAVIKQDWRGNDIKPACTGVDPSKHDMLIVILSDNTILINPTSDLVYINRKYKQKKDAS